MLTANLKKEKKIYNINLKEKVASFFLQAIITFIITVPN